MAQHDMNIANQGFPAFRSDLNDALSALVSTSSGATAPSTTFANQLWYDTTNNKLKIRNEDNDAWIEILTLNQTTDALDSISGYVIGTNVQAYDANTAKLNVVQSWTANQTFDDLTFRIKGTSTGVTSFDSLNASATSYTVFIPAANTYLPVATQTITFSGPSAARTYTFPDSNSTVAVLGTAQTFTAAQRGSITALTDGATITPDFAATNNFSLTIGGNRTLANPTNITAGQSGAIVITQDGTGSRTLAYGSNWKFPGGTAPTLTTTANAVDVLVYYVESATRISARLISDTK